MNYKQNLHTIKVFIFDYDGVMSDGNLYIGGENTILRSGNVKDGYAVQHAVKMGYRTVVLSGGKGESIQWRCEQLGIKDVICGAENKAEILQNFLMQNNIAKEQVLYLGDDIPDYDAMLLCGIKCCPKDAAIEIKQIADYISDRNGGQGCVRDVIEQTMRLQGTWFNEHSKIW